MNETSPEITERARTLIAENSGISEDEIGLDTELEALGLDSLDVLKIAVAFERSFGVEIETEELAEITTLRQVTLHLSRKLSHSD